MILTSGLLAISMPMYIALTKRRAVSVVHSVTLAGASFASWTTNSASIAANPLANTGTSTVAPPLAFFTERLKIGPFVTQVRDLSRPQLAELYRRAAVVLVPSEAEGFGLPVVEALACGAAVVASDIPALREAGGAAAVFRPVGDVAAWAATVTELLKNSAAAPPSDTRLSHAAKFSWAEHARVIADTYRRLAA